MKQKNDEQKAVTFFQQLNRHIGSMVNAIEVSILVFCVASLAVLLMTNVFARTFFQSIYFTFI